MASLAVTSVTPVSTAKCHACHAPRGRDISRDITGVPPFRGDPLCHACHAGLISGVRYFVRDIFVACRGAAQ